ncbi:Na+/H+ antiporter [Camelliibacillus cellulosilyticus]|uniref:Na+/H+ antiporter n=1 Tax=Camelliibacillus cellulosilyticus TaxID=2174486 RepID=A0ABV9GP43_9BACL
MGIFLIVLLLLALIGLSNLLNHVVPFIPVPLIQIALGIIAAVLPFGIHVPMESELFLVLFIAPLLFNDGRNVSRSALWKLRTPILLLALGLVFVTVFVVGAFIHWLIPTIPLPAAFALAAILSPTDVVAVSAMSSRVHMPKGVMHLLEGEGLMNDASGLVAFNFAVTAMVTGAFSLATASLSFLLIAIGGFLGGAVLAFLIIRFRVFIRRLGMEDVTVHMLIQILTPFLVYLVIEHFHLSGILAVVSAGIIHGIEKERERSPTIDLQIVSKSTWTVILYVLNGMVFVLLGLQIPNVAGKVISDPAINNFAGLNYVFAVAAALLLLRFIWVSLSWWFGWTLKMKRLPKPLIKPIGLITVSGARGAVTLAGAFSIPFVLADGSPFPERNLIIFIAAGVILVTLLIASIFLPIIAKTETDPNIAKKAEAERSAVIQTKIAAVRATQEMINEENRQAAYSIIAEYNRAIHQLKYEDVAIDSDQIDQMKTDIRTKALEAESFFIAKLLKERRIDREAALHARAYIRRKEAAVNNRIKYRMLLLWTLFVKTLWRLSLVFARNKEKISRKRRIKQDEWLRLKKQMAEAALQTLKEQMTPENKAITYLVIGEYYEQLTTIDLLHNADASKKYEHVKRELKVKAFQAERDEAQSLYEKKYISVDMVRKIRRQINIREAFWMEENSLRV